MPDQVREVVVGLDNGGTAINATVLDCSGRFLVDRLVETPSFGKPCSITSTVLLCSEAALSMLLISPEALN